MRASEVAVIDASVTKAEELLRRLQSQLRLPDRHDAYKALRAVIHTLRDRLPVQEAIRFGAHLPLVIRGIYYEGWQPGRSPQPNDAMSFLQTVFQRYGLGTLDPYALVGAVWSLLDRTVDTGEINEVLANLPTDIVDLLEAPIGVR